MNAETTRASGVRVNSVANALAMLRRLAATDRPEGVSSIARATKVSPSSCFSILKTLVAEDFLRFDADRKTYSLGPAAIDLAIAALDPEAGFQRARTMLEQLARHHGVTAGLWRLSDCRRLTLLGAAESAENVRIRLTTGQRLPMMTGAMGRCIAARSDMADEYLSAQLNSLDWTVRPPLDRYRAELRAYLKNGFAIDDGDFLQGITTVAAPVIDRDGTITHCIAATTFSGRRGVEALQHLGKAVRAAAQESSGLLVRVR